MPLCCYYTTTNHLVYFKRLQRGRALSYSFSDGYFYLGSLSCVRSFFATKMKGLFKGLKYISHLFVQKEHDMEIGYPTDVRHVAHIGWDNPSGSAPAWLSEFKTSSDFSSASLSNLGQSRETSWASQDFDQPKELQPLSGIFADHPCPDIPKGPKKSRRKAKDSSPSSSARSSKSRASYTTAIEDTSETPHEYQMV